jgi:hypothetical protein
VSPNGIETSRKWFMDYGNVDIMIYSLIFIMIVIHGRVNIKRKRRDEMSSGRTEE